MAATSQAQAEAAKEVQKAGVEHAKAKGEYLGRKPSYTRLQYQAVLDLLAQGAGDFIAHLPNVARGSSDCCKTISFRYGGRRRNGAPPLRAMGRDRRL